jgi:hypothetical protein
VLANALPLNGLNTGEISDRFDVYFVPAGYVFSIWGLIYIGMIAYSVYQALPGQRERESYRATGYVYVLSALANIVWLFLWHYEVFEFTILAMLALLFCLIAIYLRFDIGRQKVGAVEKWAVHVTFSIYLGWITVATIANATQLLDYLGWGGWGIPAEYWAVIMLLAGVVISGLMSFRRGDIAYSLVLIWAYAGIGIKQAGVTIVSYTAWAAIAAIIIILIVAGIRKRSNG